MTIEIIVATYNRPGDLKKFFESVLNLSLLPNMITIVDAGSKSLDYEYYKNTLSSKNVLLKVIQTNLLGLTVARNIGIKNSSGDLVLFSDDDVILHRDYFKEAIKAFENDKKNEIGGLTGRLENYEPKLSGFSIVFRKLFYLPTYSNAKILKSGWANWSDHASHSSCEVQWMSGCNMFFRKEVFDYFLFDENLKRHAIDDVDYTFRVSRKYKLFYCGLAKYSHFPSKESRINNRDKYLFLARNHHYLFKKNFKPYFKTSVPHYISLVGMMLQALFLQRTFKGFLGAFKGLMEIIFKKY